MNLFKKSNKSFSFKNIVPMCARLWEKSYKFIFVLFFAALVGLGAYIWYQSIYSGEWNADKKQQYLDSQEKSVTLKMGDFNKALNDIDQREKAFHADYTPIKDVFVPYPGAPTQSNQ
jgi:hypothetical protein